MFKIDIQGVTAAAERLGLAQSSLDRETTNWLVDMSQWVKDDLKRRVPVKTGQLRNSVRYELTRKTDGGGDATFHSVFYGAMLDEGAQPYTIHAKGKAMAFSIGGEKVFASTVQHPGYKPRNFTIESLNAAEPEADRMAEAISERIFRAVIM